MCFCVLSHSSKLRTVRLHTQRRACAALLYRPPTAGSRLPPPPFPSLPHTRHSGASLSDALRWHSCDAAMLGHALPVTAAALPARPLSSRALCAARPLAVRSRALRPRATRGGCVTLAVGGQSPEEMKAAYEAMDPAQKAAIAEQAAAYKKASHPYFRCAPIAPSQLPLCDLQRARQTGCNSSPCRRRAFVPCAAEWRKALRESAFEG